MLYAVGGLTSACEALNTVEKYNPLVDMWELVSSMKTCRSRVGVAVLDGRLFAMGGYDGLKRLDTVGRFTYSLVISAKYLQIHLVFETNTWPLRIVD